MRTGRGLRRISALAAFVAAALSAPAIAATECHPPTGISPCLDAQGLWLPPGRARFVSIASARTLPSGVFSAGFGIGYTARPVVLHAPSPDPEGRELNVVDDMLDASLLYAHGIAERIEATVALPFVAYQTGAGAEGATTQSARPITAAALRDPRLGAAAALFWHGSTSHGYGAKMRLEIVVPLGDEAAYAGNPSFGTAPSAVLELRHGRFWAGSELGLRLRRAVALGDARWGSQGVISLGAGVDLLLYDRLSVLAETWMLPVLISQERALRRGGQIDEALLVPAEWLASVRSQPLSDLPLSFQLGAGTGIPLSSARRTTAAGAQATETFGGITTPTWRTVFVARYTSN
jgi:hypothetical protein